MQWIVEYWFLVVFGGGMIAMHLFGHRGHGAKRRGGGGCCGGKTDPQEKDAVRQEDVSSGEAHQDDN